MPKDPVETPARTSLTELKKLLTELKKWRARVKQPSDYALCISERPLPYRTRII